MFSQKNFGKKGKNGTLTSVIPVPSPLSKRERTFPPPMRISYLPENGRAMDPFKKFLV